MVGASDLFIDDNVKARMYSTISKRRLGTLPAGPFIDTICRFTTWFRNSLSTARWSKCLG